MEEKETFIIRQKVSKAKKERAIEFRQKMTPMEQKLWDQLKTNQLSGFHFRRQQVIAGFILVVEVDGDVHKHSREEDEERERVLKSKGLRIIRFTNEEIERDIEKVLQQILVYCRDVTKTID